MHKFRSQAGGSLVSLMIGLMVSMLLMLALVSSIRFYGQTQNNALGGAASLQARIGALDDMARESRNAGVGFFHLGQRACDALNIYDGVSKSVIADNQAVLPVQIQDGGSGSDQVSFASFGTLMSGVAIPVRADMRNAHAYVELAGGYGLAENQMVMLANPGSGAPCTLGQVSKLLDLPQGFRIQMTPGQATRWNPPNPNAAFSVPVTYPKGSILYAVPGLPRVMTYSHTGQALQFTEALSARTGTLAQNVVRLKAWYGVSSTGAATIDLWTPASGAWAAPLSSDKMAQVRAIRVVLVTQSPQPAESLKDPEACTTTTTAPVSWPGGPALDVSGIAGWKCYRFGVSHVVLPLTNLIFAGA